MERYRFEVSPAAAKLTEASRASGQDLDKRLVELVKVRVSQLNGCSFCLDMHTKLAHKAGESTDRLLSVAAWRESPKFLPGEKLALQLAEHLTTQITVPIEEELFEKLRGFFDEAQIVNLIFTISVINAWNRAILACGTEPGSRDSAYGLGMVEHWHDGSDRNVLTH